MSETRQVEQDGEVTPVGADFGWDRARIGRVAGQPSQMLIQFERGILDGTGAYLDQATLSFRVGGVVGDPEGAFGEAEIALLDEDLGDPASAADYGATPAASSRATRLGLLPAGRTVTLDVTAALLDRPGAYEPIVFRISFPDYVDGAVDAYVWIETTESASGHAPTLFMDGGLLGY